MSWWKISKSAQILKNNFVTYVKILRACFVENVDRQPPGWMLRYGYNLIMAVAENQLLNERKKYIMKMEQ